jgi:tRNA(Arg) A34 adenosine deaminase TadA
MSNNFINSFVRSHNNLCNCHYSIPIYSEKTDINKKIHKFDDYIIRYALKIAEKSDMKCKHGCVIIDRKGSIISAQHNKMIHVPNIKELNKNFQKGKKMSIHAEENALRNVDQTKLNGATMYVVRKGCEENNLLCMNSKPCKRCTIIIKVFMKKHGLKNVMYSSD